MADDELPVEIRLAALEDRVARLEGGRSGRKALPIVITCEGTCGVTASTASEECEHASIYRHQQGCRGTACVEITRAYYKDYREKKAAASG